MINMSIFAFIGYIAGVVGFIATTVAAYLVTKSTTTKVTIESQKELINTLIAGKDEQKDQIAELHNKHAESVKAIGNLQGQIDILKNIPLKEIAADLNQLSKDQKIIAQETTKIASESGKTAKTQKEILELMPKLVPAN
jgi:phage I-like protein